MRWAFSKIDTDTERRSSRLVDRGGPCDRGRDADGLIAIGRAI
jgi:hypothetical protein